MNTDKFVCGFCETPFSEHKSFIGLCAENAELKKMFGQLDRECAEAKDANVTYRLKTLEMSYRIVELEDQLEKKKK